MPNNEYADPTNIKQNKLKVKKEKPVIIPVREYIIQPIKLKKKPQKPKNA